MANKSVLILGGMGYIGCQLYEFLHKAGYDCFSVDLDLFPWSKLAQDKRLPNLKKDYNWLNDKFISEFDNIILLAGHSSVPACDLNPTESLHNNFSNFEQLVTAINTTKRRFIYASSASVYGNNLNCTEDMVLTNPLKGYDYQKQMIDSFMKGRSQFFLPGRWFGLRFGTVCGYSHNPRNELMINSMTRDAMIKGVVKVSNHLSSRAILGMVDLCRSIKHILDNNLESGYYNLASFNTQIYELGEKIAGHFDAKLEVSMGSTSPYSFTINTDKFTSTGFKFIETPKLIAERARMNDFTIERDWNIKI